MTVESFAAQWEAAQGRAKGQVIAEMCEQFGWSKQTCYRKLAALGYTSGKKRRADKGESSISKKDLQVLSSMLREGIRKNGKAQLGIPEARSIMAMNGFHISVGNRQLARLLEQLNLSAKALRTIKTHTHLQSLHPNHVWQLDPSFCTLYYLRNGRQVIIEDDEAYKNKHEIFSQITKKKCQSLALCTHRPLQWLYICALLSDRWRNPADSLRLFFCRLPSGKNATHFVAYPEFYYGIRVAPTKPRQ